VGVVVDAHRPPMTGTARHVARFALAGALLATGIGHFTWGRRGFRVAVPPYVPFDPDAVVLASGAVEVALAAGLAVAPQPARRRVGMLTALFFVAVFPGNISQWATRRNAPGLDTDDKRFARLFLQPVLVWMALWATRR